MDLRDAIFEMIDMRSFSNLWSWIGLAATWASAAYIIIGVPYSMLNRARRYGGQAEEDLASMVRLRVNRIVLVQGTAGAVAFGIGSFVLTALAMLGFVYDVEFCQAVFMLFLPLG